MLTLRAGLGRARPHSRSEVARITHLRRARVVTLERRGLRRLRTLNREGACRADDAAAAAVAPVATSSALPPGGAAPDRGAVLAEHQSGSDKAGGSQGHRKPATAELSISRPARIPGGDSFDLALILAPLAVLAFLLVITREVRRAG